VGVPLNCNLLDEEVLEDAPEPPEEKELVPLDGELLLEDESTPLVAGTAGGVLVHFLGLALDEPLLDPLPALLLTLLGSGPKLLLVGGGGGGGMMPLRLEPRLGIAGVASMSGELYFVWLRPDELLAWPLTGCSGDKLD
jgi:hypothetical protein